MLLFCFTSLVFDTLAAFRIIFKILWSISCSGTLHTRWMNLFLSCSFHNDRVLLFILYNVIYNKLPPRLPLNTTQFPIMSPRTEMPPWLKLPKQTQPRIPTPSHLELTPAQPSVHGWALQDKTIIPSCSGLLPHAI